MEVQRTNLTENAEKRLARGEVTVQKTNGTTFGMVQMLTITNMVGAQAHLARVGTPMAREGKYTDARLLKMASFGVLCPSTTPEGKDVGLIESLSLGVHVRFHTPTSTMLETLRRLRTSGTKHGFPLVVTEGFESAKTAAARGRKVFESAVATTERLR